MGQRCTPFPYLGNGWTDCAENLVRGYGLFVYWGLRARRVQRSFCAQCVVMDHQLCVLHVLRVEHIVRAHVRISFSNLAIHWTLCREIWYIVCYTRMRFTQDGGYLQERMCSCTRIQTYPFASARSSLKRCLAGS